MLYKRRQLPGQNRRRNQRQLQHRNQHRNQRQSQRQHRILDVKREAIPTKDNVTGNNLTLVAVFESSK